MMPSRYQCLVRRIPNIGTTNTKHWYNEYQALVRQIPNVGTTNTKRWYDEYQALVQTILKSNEIRGSAK